MASVLTSQVAGVGWLEWAPGRGASQQGAGHAELGLCDLLPKVRWERALELDRPGPEFWRGDRWVPFPCDGGVYQDVGLCFAK